MNAFEINQHEVDSAPVVTKKRRRAKADTFKTVKPNPFAPKPKRTKPAVSAEPEPESVIAPDATTETTAVDLCPALVDGELRIRDIDLAKRLGFKQPLHIRTLIKRYLPDLERFGVLFTVKKTSGPDGGRPTDEFHLNRRQSAFLCTKSDLPIATDVVIDVIEKFEAYERGAAQPQAPVDWRDPDQLIAMLADYAPRLKAAGTKVLEQAVVIQQREAEASALGAKVERLASKADALDLLSAKVGEAGLMETSRALTGRPMALIEVLKARKIIFRESETSAWQPNARYGESGAGYLVVRERPDRYRENVSHPQCMVTAKGRAWIAELLAQIGLPLSASRKGKWRPPLTD